MLNVVRHDLELICDAAHIPGDIEIDLTGYELGDSIHISQVKLPKGSKSAIEDRDFTIATVVAPSALKSDEDADAATAAAAAEESAAPAEEGGEAPSEDATEA